MNPVIILARLILPLSVLKWTLIGGVISIWLDNIDWHIKILLGIQPIGDYQLIDKFLDMYFLSLLVIIASKWSNGLIKNVALGLFFYRFLGFVLFEITQVQWVLFLFPNIFENFFYFLIIVKRIAIFEPVFSRKMIGLFLLLVSIPKIMQEYSFHVIQKNLELNIFGFNYVYDGTTHQIAYILFFAVLFGFIYRKRGNRFMANKG